MIYINYIFLITAVAYAAAILFLRRGLYVIEREYITASTPTVKLKKSNDINGNNDNNDNDNDSLKFSVIIAARNEEENIEQCLKSVFAQDLTSDKYEVIVIDDRSEDNTSKILNELAERYSNLKIITIYETPHGVAPKKHAVSVGINAASNDIIVFTDADCRVPQTWLSTIKKYFSRDTGLVQGITSYKYIDGMNKLFFGLQATDFFSHGVVAAAAIGANLPINSNANNFAFRKTAFDEVGGYGEGGRIVSGDDDYMLQKIWSAGKHSPNKWRVRFMSDPAGSVETAPTKTVGGVFEQRKRWGSKTVHYHAGQVVLLSSAFLFYVSTLASAVLAIFAPSFLQIFLLMMGIKILGELTLMIPATHIFNKKYLIKYIVPTSLIQLPVVVAAVFFGVFGKFEWKGKKTGRTV